MILIQSAVIKKNRERKKIFSRLNVYIVIHIKDGYIQVFVLLKVATLIVANNNDYK